MASFKTFSKFFDTYIHDAVLSEARFRQSKKVKHIADLPMFSLFIDNDILDNENTDKLSDSDVQSAFKEARNKISKMGFPAMHANVVFKDLSEEVNQNTGGGVGGQAHQKGKYMAIGIDQISNPEYFVKLIIHEWAHLWMFNNSKGFKKAVKEYYDQLLGKYKTGVGKLQQQKEKQAFKNITSFQNFKNMDKRLGSQFQDDLYTEIVKKMMLDVNNFYYDYIYNKYADDDWPFKEDEKTWYKKSRESKIGSIISLITKIIKDITDKTYIQIDIKKYENQIRYLSNAIWKIFYESVWKNVLYSVSNDESDYKWAKEEGDEWATRFESPLEYLEGLTNHNENFLFDKTTSYNDISNKFNTFNNRRHDPPSMIINLVYHMFENAVEKENFPEDATNLQGKSRDSNRAEMSKLVDWTNSYGMSNDDELWATGIEEFLKLPSIHRKNILRLMATR